MGRAKIIAMHKLNKNPQTVELAFQSWRERINKINQEEISLVVQWLRLCIPNEGSPGLIPGQGTISHLQQLRVCVSQLKIPRATA